MRGKNTVSKVLGLTLKTEQDDFVFDLRNLMDFLKDERNTKRGVLQAAACIFNSTGFLSPFTIRVKCLFQKIWEHGLEWDDNLPEDRLNLWNQWCTELRTEKYTSSVMPAKVHTVLMHIYEPFQKMVSV